MSKDGRRRPGPTIADVARAAGVSLGTASNVLSGKVRVRPDTRERVQRAIVELEYRPNRVARSLIRRSSTTIGMVVPDISNLFFAEIMLGAEGLLSQGGYAVLFGTSENDPDRERRYVNEFADRQVDGIIVDATSDEDAPDMTRLGERLPLVVVDRCPPDWNGDRVVVDNREGIRLAVEHLLHLGHQRIAFVNGHLGVANARERRDAFEDELERRGLRPTGITDGQFTLASGHAQAKYLLSRRPLPTAICAGNDVLALAVVITARELGIRVPVDLSVVGYDDSAYASLSVPPLTTVRQSARALGEEAAAILLRRLSGDDSPAIRVTLAPELVVRLSTAPPAAPLS